MLNKDSTPPRPHTHTHTGGGAIGEQVKPQTSQILILTRNNFNEQGVISFEQLQSNFENQIYTRPLTNEMVAC